MGIGWRERHLMGPVGKATGATYARLEVIPRDLFLELRMAHVI